MAKRALYTEGMSHSSPIPAAKICGNMLLSSLITGADPVTREMPQSLEGQARNMFAQMKRIIAHADIGLDDVAKVTIWLNNRNDRKAINAFWEELFPNPATRPARVTLNRDLGGGKKIEAEIFAVLPN